MKSYWLFNLLCFVSMRRLVVVCVWCGHLSPGESRELRTKSFLVGCQSAIKWEVFSVDFVSNSIWAGNLRKPSVSFSLGHVQMVQIHVTILSLLSAYFGFLSSFLYFHVNVKFTCSWRVARTADRLPIPWMSVSSWRSPLHRWESACHVGLRFF